MSKILVLSNVRNIKSYFEKETLFDKIVDFDSPKKELNEYEIIVACPSRLDQEMLKTVFDGTKKVKTKWINSTWAGVDSLMKKAGQVNKSGKQCTYRPILTKSGDGMKFLMSEWVVQWILNETRNLQLMLKFNAKCEWDKAMKSELTEYRALRYQKFAVFGYGNIGKFVTESLLNFGVQEMSVLKRKIGKEERKHKSITFFDNINDLIKNKGSGYDFIISILPSTKETMGLLDNDVLKGLCGKDGTSKTVFLNAGRGSLLSEDSIVTALNKNYLKKAILDVVPEEPLPKKSKLWKLVQSGKLVVSPHCAATSLAEEVFDEFLSNYNLYTKGSDLERTVSWKKGY